MKIKPTASREEVQAMARKIFTAAATGGVKGAQIATLTIKKAAAEEYLQSLKNARAGMKAEGDIKKLEKLIGYITADLKKYEAKIKELKEAS